ncbi:MAG: histidine kinase [Promicromonosporaceae bacterium]|nr:histidine kinase [Promicromonosporaceae bacterium]
MSSLPSPLAEESLAARYARMGLLRDLVHFTARKQIGRICVLTSTLLTGAAITVMAFDGGLVGHILTLLVGLTIHSAACWVAWSYGAFEPGRAGAEAVDAEAIGANSTGAKSVSARRTIATGAIGSWTQRAGLALAVWLGTALLVVDRTGGQYPYAAYQIAEYVLMVSAFTFTAAVFSQAVTGRWFILLQVVMVAAVAGMQWLAGMPARPDLWMVSMVTATVLVQRLRLTEWHEQLRAGLESELEALTTLTAAEERLALARDLHDTTGSTLTTIVLKADISVAYQAEGDQRAMEETKDIGRLARGALKDTRAMAAAYRRTDLPRELKAAQALLRAAGVEASLPPGAGEDWPEPLQDAFGWVLREATTNLTRHSRATQAAVTLAATDGTYRLTIWNDGAGRPARQAGQGGAGRVDSGLAGSGPGGSSLGGSGLAGLRERMAAIGGRLEVAREGDSFSVTASVTTGPAGQAERMTS